MCSYMFLCFVWHMETGAKFADGPARLVLSYESVYSTESPFWNSGRVYATKFDKIYCTAAPWCRSVPSKGEGEAVGGYPVPSSSAYPALLQRRTRYPRQALKQEMALIAVPAAFTDWSSFDDLPSEPPGRRPNSTMCSLLQEMELILPKSAMGEYLSESVASVCETSPIITKLQSYPRFVCDHPGCGRAFAKKWNLQAHSRLHTGKKPFECCHGCGERLMWISSLKSHERRKCRLLPALTRVQKRKRLRPAAVKRAPSPSLSVGSYSEANETTIVSDFPLLDIDERRSVQGNQAFLTAIDFSHPATSPSTVNAMPDPSDSPLPGMEDARPVTDKQGAMAVDDIWGHVPPEEDIALELEDILSSFF